jgi:hypothetical protein
MPVMLAGYLFFHSLLGENYFRIVFSSTNKFDDCTNCSLFISDRLIDLSSAVLRLISCTHYQSWS